MLSEYTWDQLNISFIRKIISFVNIILNENTVVLKKTSGYHNQDIKKLMLFLSENSLLLFVEID